MNTLNSLSKKSGAKHFVFLAGRAAASRAPNLERGGLAAASTVVRPADKP
jgi:hypothetical protein